MREFAVFLADHGYRCFYLPSRVIENGASNEPSDMNHLALFSGEGEGLGDEGLIAVLLRVQPLTPSPLSPEYRGEGSQFLLFTFQIRRGAVTARASIEVEVGRAALFQCSNA
jgi:hypothetical protein